MLLKIQVGEYQIKNGFRDCPNFCPVKFAVDIRLPAFWKCKVYQFHVRVGNKRGSWVDVPLPADVSARIQRYDEGGGMDPFEFVLDVPDSMFL